MQEKLEFFFWNSGVWKISSKKKLKSTNGNWLFETIINLKGFNQTLYMNSPKKAEWGNMAVGFLFLQEK